MSYWLIECYFHRDTVQWPENKISTIIVLWNEKTGNNLWCNIVSSKKIKSKKKFVERTPGGKSGISVKFESPQNNDVS